MSQVVVNREQSMLTNRLTLRLSISKIQKQGLMNGEFSVAKPNVFTGSTHKLLQYKYHYLQKAEDCRSNPEPWSPILGFGWWLGW